MACSALKCPIEDCKFETRQEKRFLEHITAAHSRDPESVYIDHILDGAVPTCECKCGMRTPWHGWKRGHGKLLRGHNARMHSVFSDPATIEKCVQSRAEGFREGRHCPWNSGLTAAEDARVANSREKSGRTLRTRYNAGDLVSWQTGLTAADDARVKKMSETKKLKFASGEIHSWNEGLTKENCESLVRSGQRISASYAQREAGRRLQTEDVQARINSMNFDLIEDTYRQLKGSRLLVRCRSCSACQERTLYSIEKTKKCFSCCPKETAGHLEILEFIRSLAADVESNDRSLIGPLELDLVIPSSRLAIEYNGLYWHSEEHRGKTYHADKTKAVESLGYRLLHVFEDEWRDRRSVVESMIRHRLGAVDRRVGARQCELRDVDSSERSRFFDTNHIDGDVRSSAAWGLFLGDELVACLSVRRPIHRKWAGRLEVARFAVKSGASVSGALSRLTTAALAHTAAAGLEGLMSYVDTRYGNGQGYLRAGYRLHSRSGPTFWWTDFSERHNRFRYRADKLRGLTESQVAQASGMSKVWGCDQLVLLRDAP